VPPEHVAGVPISSGETGEAARSGGYRYSLVTGWRDRRSARPSAFAAGSAGRSLAAALLMLLLLPPACFAFAQASAPGPACGAAAARTRAEAAELVAGRIYGREVSSPEVRRDKQQVERYEPLLSALAARNRAAVGEAVTSLVFSHTHVVRLRVSQGGSLLADVGGPLILAPVGGSLHLHGRTVGHYLLSVQDDSGYVKLESRYVGYPLLMRQGSRRLPVEGTFSPAAASIPDRGPVSWHGASYEAVSFAAHAYPSGPLTLTMLVPAPGSSSSSCATIHLAELNRISQRIWNRFMQVGGPVSGFVSTTGSLVGALTFVRAASHQLAGSTRPGPPRLPAAGSVSYRGVIYRVFSFAASAGGTPVRVYGLVPA
jgi:hypothetical protein